MSKLTRRLDQFFFPPLCVNCRAPTDWACPIVAWRGWDMLIWWGYEHVAVPVPVCDDCRASRVRAGRLAVTALVLLGGLLAWVVSLFRHAPRGSAGETVALVCLAGIIGLVWYGRNRMNRDLDRALLGVRDAGINSATNEVTLWFRDPPALGDDRDRFPAGTDDSVPSRPATGVGYADLALAEGRANEVQIAPLRTPALAGLEAEDFRLQVGRRPFVVGGGAVVLAYAVHLFRAGEAMSPQPRGGSFPIGAAMGCIGLMLLGFGGLSIDMAGDRIVRSWWGLRKTLHRRTTVIRKHAPNGLHLVDDRGTRLWVTTQVVNFQRLFAECRLRTDVLAPPANAPPSTGR